MVEEGDLDDKLEDKATNEVVDDVKKVAMEGVDKEKKQVAMKVANTNCLDVRNKSPTSLISFSS